SRRRHTRCYRDWSSDVCSSDLRYSFLLNVGLEYLSLNRTARTISGGEGQRIRLATQLGSALSGVLYILDEPSIGLHQRDNDRLRSEERRVGKECRSACWRETYS